MFRCEFSGEVSAPKESPVRLVVKTRTRNYDHNFKTEEGWESFQSSGTEIVKEISIRLQHVEAAKKKFGVV